MTIRILDGDCRVEMQSLEAGSVQTCMTSPPYWGLRSYSTPPLIWGGDPACAHDFTVETITQDMRKGLGLAALGERYRGGGHKQAKTRHLSSERGWCARCGAWRGHYGLEPDYRLYVEHTVEIFRGVWRVLREDGTLWLNLGDCYATGAGTAISLGGTAGSNGRPETNGRSVEWGFRDRARGGARRPAMGKHADLEGEIEEVPPNRMPQPGMRPKSKMGIPWRVAFALQDDGWILRQDIIWYKLNPMPESTTDRPTTAHEFLFLFAKSARTLLWRHREHGWTETRPAPDYVWRNRESRAEVKAVPADVGARDADGNTLWIRVNLWRGHDYYYDAEAIMEPSSPDSHARAARGRSEDHKYADGGPGGQTAMAGNPVAGTYRPAVAGWDRSTGDGGHGSVHRQTVDSGEKRLENGRAAASPRMGRGPGWRAGANSRENVDRVPDSRKAGVNPKAAREEAARGDGPKSKQNANYSEALGSSDLIPFRNKRSVWPLATEAFRGAHFATFPTDLVRPCILAGSRRGDVVLDPFGGAGTTAMVADQEQRHAVSIELNADYVEMQTNRLQADAPPLFADIQRS